VATTAAAVILCPATGNGSSKMLPKWVHILTFNVAKMKQGFMKCARCPHRPWTNIKMEANIPF